MPEVSSSAIQRIEYDAGLRKLLVIFLETGAYTYFDVPRPVYEQFLDAPRKASSSTRKSATDIRLNARAEARLRRSREAPARPGTASGGWPS